MIRLENFAVQCAETLLQRIEREIIQSPEYRKYFSYQKGTYFLERVLKDKIWKMVNYSEGNQEARQVWIEHFLTQIKTYHEYCVIQGYTIDGVFYEIRTEHNRAQEICEKNLPLETRIRSNLHLHSIYLTKSKAGGDPSQKNITAEDAIAQGLALENVTLPAAKEEYYRSQTIED